MWATALDSTSPTEVTKDLNISQETVETVMEIILHRAQRHLDETESVIRTQDCAGQFLADAPAPEVLCQMRTTD